MNISKARALFEKIAEGDRIEYSLEEYLDAVETVADMPVHNVVTKDELVKVCRWVSGVAKKLFARIEDSESSAKGIQFVYNAEIDMWEGYDDTYDITIHCRNEGEQKKILEGLRWHLENNRGK